MKELRIPFMVGSFYLWNANDPKSINTDLFMSPHIICIGLTFGTIQRDNAIAFYESWYQRLLAERGIEPQSEIDLKLWSDLLESNKIIMPSPKQVPLMDYVKLGMKRGKTRNLIHGLFYAIAADGYIRKLWLPQFKEIMSSQTLNVINNP